MSFEKYINIVSGNFRKAVKVEWLNPDETVNFEFTNSLYDINVDLSVNYQNGSRRTCTLTLNNTRNKFPINFNNIWIGQKFKLWMGVYIDEKTPYYLPQGVFYVSNPNEVYQPTTKTIKINGVDKWAFLDGTLHGKLSGIYQTNINTDLRSATRELLRLPTYSQSVRILPDNIDKYFDVTDSTPYCFDYVATVGAYRATNVHNTYSEDPKIHGSTAQKTLRVKENMTVSFNYNYITEQGCDKLTIKVGDKYVANAVSGTGSGTFNGVVAKGEVISFSYVKNNAMSATDEVCSISNLTITLSKDVVDPITPMISPYFDTKKSNIKDEKNNDVEVEVWKCPYTAKVERGKTYADVLLEYATILCSHIYYDVNGRLIIEPMIDTADDITDTNKEIIWHYTVDEKAFLGLTQTYNFENIYNDIIVLGNIVNGRQFKARVQNRNLLSDTCVQKIGIKTKEPFEDNQYYSDEQCKELAMYYAKVDTILQKSGNIDSIPLYHFDVNKMVAVSTPNNNMSKELFLVTGFTLNSSGTMSVNVTSVNILKNFSVVEVEMDG